MIRLYEHNEIAYRATEEMLCSAGKAAVIHPTGTGKSFIGFKLCQQHPDKRICWLSPSAYIFETQLEALRAAADGYSPENISFYTYSKLTMLGAEQIEEIQPDYIILDEFHRCGAPTWGEAVQRLLKAFPKALILGLSATNVRYLDSQRDMALELFDGCIASEMTLGEAVVRGILTPPKYVLSVFKYQQDMERYKQRIMRAKSAEVRHKAEQYLEALRRSLENAAGLDEIFNKHMPDRAGKYIVFCADMEHMRQMMAKASEWFSKIDEKPYIYHVYSDDPMAEKEFREFKENRDPEHLKLLYCIDALNEGVHVKGISGVILLRPTISPIIYKQQIGRAMAANTSHEVVIFDIVMNIDNLYSISTLRQEMEMAVSELVYNGEGGSVVNESFEIIDELRDSRRVFDQLNDCLSASWEMMYNHAKNYYESHGDLEIAKRYKTEEGYSLGAWIAVQRRVYSGQAIGILTARQKAKLEAIGMRWNSISDASWEKHIAAAENYYKEHGNLAVKSKYVSDTGVKLGSWLSNIRASQGKKLSAERRKQLEELGMIWDVRAYQWQVNFSAARKYYEQHGDLNVPVAYVSDDGVQLGQWISNLKNANKDKAARRISPEQIQALEAIGMNWESRYDAFWNSSYELAKEYYLLHENLDVPSTYKTPEGGQLGRWISRQRISRQKQELSREKILLLDEIGMIWQKPDPWKQRYDIARRYFQEHGNVRLSTATVIDGVWIGKWLSEQCKNRARLSAEQQRLLMEIGVKL